MSIYQYALQQLTHKEDIISIYQYYPLYELIVVMHIDIY